MKGLRRFWISQSVGVKAAIISGIFVLTTGICSVIVALITIYPDLVALKLKETDTPSLSTPSLVIEKATVFTDWRLWAQEGDQTVYVIPDQCLIFSNGNLDQEIQNTTSLEAISSFLVISSKAAIIKDVQVVLDEYLPPITADLLDEFQVEIGQPGGGINAIDLGKIIINQNFDEKTLTPLESYNLENQDALRFYFTTNFQEPGQYSYHVLVKARTMEGEMIQLESEKFFFYWIIANKLQPKNIIDTYTKNSVSFTTCK